MLDKKEGFMNIKMFFINLLNKIKEADLPTTGAMLAYFMLLSIFPFLIFLLNIISIAASGYDKSILEAMNYLPQNVADILLPVIQSLIRSSSGTLMSLSLIIALWAGSSGIIKLMRSINIAFGVEEQRGIIQERLMGIFFTIALAVILTLMLLSNVFGNIILNLIKGLIGDYDTLDQIWNTFRSIVPLLAIVLVFTLLYRISPNLGGKHRVNVWDVVPGALFTSIAWILITFVFSFYVDNFGNYDRTYGSLGGIIVMMMWLYLSSMIMVLGAYVASTHMETRRKKQLERSIFGTVQGIKEDQEGILRDRVE